MTDKASSEWPIPELIADARAITTWKRTQFRPSDAYVYPTREAGSQEPQIEEGGWDHEHCMLCMVEISLFPGCDPEAYADVDENKWLCSPCYERYVLPFQQR